MHGEPVQMVKNRRRKRRRSTCARKEGSVESDSPELTRRALNKEALVPAATPGACTATSCGTATEVEEEDVTSIADSPRVPQSFPGTAFVGQSDSTAAGHESLSTALPQGDVQDRCNDSACDGAMIEELLGGLCAEDVLGSFSVSVSNDPPQIVSTPHHPHCDVALERDTPLRWGESLPLSSTPLASPRSTDPMKGQVQSVSPALAALPSASSTGVELVEEPAAVLPQVCRSWDKKEEVVSGEAGSRRTEHSCCYPSGSFYGLSAEVKRLLTEARGITALYG